MENSVKLQLPPDEQISGISLFAVLIWSSLIHTCRRRIKFDSDLRINVRSQRFLSRNARKLIYPGTSILMQHLLYLLLPLWPVEYENGSAKGTATYLLHDLIMIHSRLHRHHLFSSESTLSGESIDQWNPLILHHCCQCVNLWICIPSPTPHSSNSRSKEVENSQSAVTYHSSQFRATCHSPTMAVLHWELDSTGKKNRAQLLSAVSSSSSSSSWTNGCDSSRVGYNRKRSDRLTSCSASHHGAADLSPFSAPSVSCFSPRLEWNAEPKMQINKFT